MSVLRRIRDWPGRSLRRRLGLLLAVELVVVSLLFLLLFVGLYQWRLREARAEAAARLNDLFRVALENAMLERNLDGLRNLVVRLGEQPDVQRVMILDPRGEVRFSSEPGLLGRTYARQREAGCRECHADGAGPARTLLFDDRRLQTEILRSVLPVRNRPICSGCHGPPERHPVNGVLVVDREASSIRREALLSTLVFAGSGGLVLLLTLGGLAFALDRWVLRPLRAVTRASERLAEGVLDTRIRLGGSDEIARLAGAFDRMAERIERSYRLVEQRERFTRALMEAVPDGIRVLASDYRVIAVNRRFAEMQGETAEALLARPCHAVHGRDEPCPPTLVNCPLEELRRDGERLRTVHRHLRGDGRPLAVEIIAMRVDLPVDGDTRACVIESVRDLEEQARIAEEQRLSELGQLATGVAHEIRNPLASIQIALRALARSDVDEDTRREYLELMQGEIAKCIDITDRLLRVALPPSAERQLVRVDRLVREVLSLLGWEAEQRRVEIAIDVAPEAEVLGVDSDLRMLVLNLAQNAFHAMPEGGRLSIEGRVEGERVRLVVADTGVGIPREHLARIFLPFWSHRADRVPGTGLGLWIVRGVVERHGGRIHVESEPGHGTRFVVELPSAWSELDTWERSRRQGRSS